jgi:hypothetical protein
MRPNETSASSPGRVPGRRADVLAEGDVAFTARGRAAVFEEAMAVDPEYAPPGQRSEPEFTY